MVAYCLQKTSGDRSFVPVAFENFEKLVEFTRETPHEKYLIYENSLYVPQLLCSCKDGRLLFPKFDSEKLVFSRELSDGDIIFNGYSKGIVLANYFDGSDGLLTVAWRGMHGVVVVNCPYCVTTQLNRKYFNQAVKTVSLRLSGNGEIKIAA